MEILPDFLNTLGLPNGTQNGEIVWTEEVNFIHTALQNVINSNTYTANAGTVSGFAADPTNPRIDVIVADATGAVSVQQGVAATTPVEPLILDPLTTVKLSAYTMAASSVSPQGISRTLMYAGGD